MRFARLPRPPCRGFLTSAHPPNPQFLTTQWSQVLRAGQPDAPRHRDALEALCRAYWRPLYAYLRRRGIAPDQAEEHTQAFFAHLLEKGVLLHADPARGRFRAFLLTCLKHHLEQGREAARALKRGGGRSPLSLDFGDAERSLHHEPVDEMDPAKLFDRQWALVTLRLAQDRTRAALAARGKAQLADALMPLLAQAGERGGLAAAAKRLEMNEGAVRVALHRLRKQFRDELRALVIETLADPTDVDDEIRELMAAVALPAGDGTTGA